ncbi:MAG: QVPTGV class sortase B protein-sorting domain-containing protein, partial [Saprospiraceae bacterium]|nr:QVPTGV class sortase B protein-sorting domain-containing protein [Saprospiraceae bacterium]
LFFIYMILNGVERFWIEKIRINDKYSFMGLNMTQAEYIAVLYIIVAIGCIIYFTRKHQSKNCANI